MPQPSHTAQLGVGLEAVATPGTPAAPTMWAAWKSLKPKDDLAMIEDKGMRGAPVDNYGMLPGPKGSQLDLGADVIADVIGWILASLLPDVTPTGTPTGSGATTLAGSAAAGASALSATASIPAGTLIQIGTGATAEVVTTGTPTGSGPYAIPLANSYTLKYAHASAQALTPINAAPIVHAFSTLCTGSTQPTSQTWTIFDSLGTWQYPGMQWSELSIKWNADGLLEFSAKAAGWPYVSGSTPTPSQGSVKPVANWAITCKIAGTQVFVQDGELSIKRTVTLKRGANGTQNPYRVWSGDVAVEGKMTLLPDDSTQRSIFQAGTVQAFEVAYSQGAGAAANGLTLHCSQTAFTDATPDYSKDVLELPVTFKAIANTSDAGGSAGYSPIKATLTNAVAAGSYGK